MFALRSAESRLHEAGYFHAISQNLPLTVDLIHLSLNTKTEAGAAPILEAMDKIKSLEPDVILLYTSIKNIELMLQQVYVITINSSWFKNVKIVLCSRVLARFVSLVIFDILGKKINKKKS